MSLRKLTEEECGGANALVQLSSHFTRDRAFAEAHGHGFPSSSDQLVEQFLAETRIAPQTFRMDDLMREMHEIESQRAALPPVPASTVKDHLNDDAWALQYLEDSKQFNEHPDNERIWAEVAAQANAQDNFQRHNWEDEFFQDHLENVEVQQNANELVETLSVDPRFEYTKFMRFMKHVGNGELNLQELQSEALEEAAGWNNFFLAENEEKMAAVWEKEARALEPQQTTTNEESYNNKLWDRLQDEWKKLSDVETEQSWTSEFNEFVDPHKEYTFQEENPMFDVLNPLERGKEMLEIGDLPSAVLCFEAAVKKEPENVEAWLLLGTSQAENEQDPRAIPALKQCLQLEPTNLQALMSLAVSYTNETYYNQASQCLVTWLRENSKYGDLVPQDLPLSGQVTSLVDPNHHKIVQDMFIRAAQRNPTDIDYEVQCGLGVLFNMSNEFEKAVDCFRTALGVKPEDARLWNRLGATLANGGKPEEAIEAYHRALAIVPGFIRARYNVGITCINLSAYREAAEHLLIALNQQARGKDDANSGETAQMSETIWSTLRMSVSLMNRQDLKVLCDNRDLKALSSMLEIHDN